jgi:hypothetical protein
MTGQFGQFSVFATLANLRLQNMKKGCMTNATFVLVINNRKISRLKLFGVFINTSDPFVIF